jgi:hypothetical protein
MEKVCEAYQSSSEEIKDGDESSEESNALVKLKDPCQICSQNEHKYKCPACMILTCSL